MTKIILLISIGISLFARLNPFEPVVVQTITPIEKAPIHSVDDGNRTVKIISGVTIPKKQQITKPKVVVKTKIVEKKLTKKELKTQCINLEKDIIKQKELEKAKRLAAQKAKELALIKNFKKKTYKILPFLTIKSNLKSIKVITRKQYKLIRYYRLDNDKKIAFDFKAKVDTSTKYKKFNAPYFYSYKIGNHKKEHFFRVVISVNKNINYYKVTILNNIPTIQYIK